MKLNLSKRGSKVLNIILVPVILLIILINSGILQKTLTAVKIDEKKYTALEYNYYYYVIKNDFIEENYDDLDILGFDQDLSTKNQDYNDEITWWEYFCEQATKQMAEDYYYHKLAVKDEYEFTEEELLPVEEKLEEIKTACEENSVKMDNYLKAYYGTGITEEKFKDLLTFSVKANAYKTYLENSYDVAQSDTPKWITDHPMQKSYDTVNIRMIILSAGKDREMDETGTKQMTALENKMNEMVERYQSGDDSFYYLLSSFCDDEALVEQDGVIKNATKEEIPDALESWCFSEGKEAGDFTIYIEKEDRRAYFVIYDGIGENAAEIAAKKGLAKERVESVAQSEIESYEITQYPLGMHLIDR